MEFCNQPIPNLGTLPLPLRPPLRIGNVVIRSGRVLQLSCKCILKMSFGSILCTCSLTDSIICSLTLPSLPPSFLYPSIHHLPTPPGPPPSHVCIMSHSRCPAAAALTAPQLPHQPLRPLDPHCAAAARDCGRSVTWGPQRPLRGRDPSGRVLQLKM